MGVGRVKPRSLSPRSRLEWSPSFVNGTDHYDRTARSSYNWSVNKSRPSQQKRQRERQRQERQKEKQVRRQEVAAQKATNPGRPDGVDPDLEGIQAGPQPLQDWQTETETETK
jgi:hypothetical protein